MAIGIDPRLQQPTSRACSLGSDQPSLGFPGLSRWELQRIMNSDQGRNFQRAIRFVTGLSYADESLTLQLMQAVTNVAMSFLHLPSASSIRIPPNLFTNAADSHLDPSTSNLIHQDYACIIFKGTHMNRVAHFKEYRFPATRHPETDVKTLAMRQASIRMCVAGPGLLPVAGVLQHRTSNNGTSTLLVELPLQGCMGLSDYLTKNSGTNIMLLVRDVAEPLARLHANGVVLGPITKNGVTVSLTGRACLSNLDYLRLEDPANQFVPLVNGLDTIRRLPPEIVKPSRGSGDCHFGPLTRASDVYFLGCFIFELFTDQPPFAEYTTFPRDLAAILSVLADGQRFRRPETPHAQRSGFANDVWALIESCCAIDPADRPTVSDLLQLPLKNLGDNRLT